MTEQETEHRTGRPRGTGRSCTTAIAWIATIGLSGLPQILIVEWTGMDPQSMRWIWLVLAALFVLTTAIVRKGAGPLRPYAIVMLGVVGVTFFVVPMVLGWLLPSESPDVYEIAYGRVVLGSLALGGSIALARLFGSAGSALISPGNLRAPVRGDGGRVKRRVTWVVVGPLMIILLAGGFAFQMWTEGIFTPEGTGRTLGLAPFVVIAALLNAYWEEVMFRAGPLAALQSVVGPTQAILMTSVWFGFGHYFGSIPDGLFGVIQSGLLALLLGKSMLDTQGLGWPLAIHFSIDLVVFASIAAVVA